MDAAYLNHLQLVRRLVEEEGISPNVQVTEEEFTVTPLFMAMGGGAKEVVVYWKHVAWTHRRVIFVAPEEPFLLPFLKATPPVSLSF